MAQAKESYRFSINMKSPKFPQFSYQGISGTDESAGGYVGHQFAYLRPFESALFRAGVLGR